jgi:hypothetical protein
MTEIATTQRNAHRSNSTAVAGNPVVKSRLALSGGVFVIILPILVILLGLVLLITSAGGWRS